MEERLQKIIARAGLASRRGAEKIIGDARVKVNGKTVSQPGTKADPDKDIITVDGKKLKLGTKNAYYLFYKPPGCLTTMSDPQGRPTIAPYLNKLKERVFPVGRLDWDAEGALLLTNDGDLSARLMHPKYHVPKTYRVKVEGIPDEKTLKLLAGGVLKIGDKVVKPAEVEIIKKGRDRTWLKLVLTEGRRRQIKRMCSAAGHPVMKLKRVSFGSLDLGRLPPGEMRKLTGPEINALKKDAGLK